MKEAFQMINLLFSIVGVSMLFYFKYHGYEAYKLTFTAATLAGGIIVVILFEAIFICLTLSLCVLLWNII